MFKRFKRSYSFHGVKMGLQALMGRATEAFVEELDKLTVERGYLPQQIFNMDKRPLFWKRNVRTNIELNAERYRITETDRQRNYAIGKFRMKRQGNPKPHKLSSRKKNSPESTAEAIVIEAVDVADHFTPQNCRNNKVLTKTF